MLKVDSLPLKTTEEVDWVGPLKQYIRNTYGDADRYAEVSARGLREKRREN